MVVSEARQRQRGGHSLKEECVPVQKRLYRSRRDNIIAGIAGGLGEYFDLDPTLVRLVLLLVVFAGGMAGVLLYVMAWVIMPPEPGLDGESPHSSMFAKSEALRKKVVRSAKQVEERLRRCRPARGEDEADPALTCDSAVSPPVQVEPEEEAVGGPPDTSAEDEQARRQRLGGVVLVGVGVLFVLRNFFPWINFADLWPLFIIGLGLVLILRGLSE